MKIEVKSQISSAPPSANTGRLQRIPPTNVVLHLRVFIEEFFKLPDSFSLLFEKSLELHGYNNVALSFSKLAYYHNAISHVYFATYINLGL